MRKDGWQNIVIYINNQEIGTIFNRQESLKKIPNTPKSTIDYYINALARIGVLEKTNRATHKIICKIPEKLNTILLMKLMFKRDWKQWFIPLDQRVEKEYQKHYGKG